MDARGVVVNMAIAATMAHRTTGNAPCMVHFSAVDRNLAVRASSNITGVTFGHARNLTTAGTGVVTFTASGQTIQYTAPGDTIGTIQSLTVDLRAVKLYSGNGVDWIYIDVTFASLPAGNQSDNITITSLRSSGVEQPTEVTDPGDPDYASQAYYWDFGDSNAIDYTLTNSRNSNICYGSPNTAHLFTEPGTYNVRLYMWDVDGVVTTYYESITISDQEDTATIYYVDATTGSDSDSGLTPALALQTFSAAWAKLTGNNIILKFKRGETFAASANVSTTRSDVTLTSYYNADGTDDENQPRPIISVSTTSGTFIAAGAGIDDLKLCHLHFTGPGSGTSRAFDPGNSTTPTTNSLAYDCYWTAFNTVMGIAGTTPHGNLYIGAVDCEISDIGFASGGNCFFLELNYGALLGCKAVDSEGGEHVCRIWGHDSGVIADSYFSRPANTKVSLTVRGVPFGSTNGAGTVWHKANQYTCLLRNETHADEAGTGRLAFQISPTDGVSDERLEHIIIDGHLATGINTRQLTLLARDACFRNCIFRGPQGIVQATNASGVWATWRPAWLRFFNCSIISDSDGSQIPFVEFVGRDSSTNYDPVNLQLRNLVFLKSGTSSHYLWWAKDIETTEITSDYNVCEIGGVSSEWCRMEPDGAGGTYRTLAQTQSQLSKETNSINGTIDFTDEAGGDYTLQATSDAIGAGDDALLPWVRFDAAGNLRTTDLDAGAYEYGAVAPVLPSSDSLGNIHAMGLYCLYD